LASAIQWQAGLFKRQTGISCRVRIDPEDVQVGRKASIGLFRILQELLENVILHAQAKLVQISLEKVNENLVMTVRDNGLGITKEKLSNPQSFGLISIRERAQSLEGEMFIEGRKRRGTQVVVRIPYNEKIRTE
jgi:signal transduction histidine kinase